MNPLTVKKKRIEGYVYSANQDIELFKNAKIGDVIIKQDRKPPYIVVDHSLEKIIITQWPGKLYKVEVLNYSNEKDLQKGLVKNACYTRTLGVKIVEEIPVAHMFGENGTQICQIIDLTRNITEEQVNVLSQYDVELGRVLYTKAWRNWISLIEKDDLRLNEDHYNTLNIFLENQKYSSPIREGLSIITSQFYTRAREIAGESAFNTDEEGEMYLKPKWSKACEQLRQAAMSYESDNVLTEIEKKALRKAVLDIFNL